MLRIALIVLLSPFLAVLYVACLIGAGVGIVFFGVRPHGHAPK